MGRDKWGCIPSRLCATLPPCAASLPPRASRSSSGPAGRHGPWGSDGARMTTESLRDRRLRGRGHHDGDRGFFVCLRTARAARQTGARHDMQTTILGGGRLGRAIEAAILGNGGAPPRVVGRPVRGRHDPSDLAGSDVVVDASSGDPVRANVDAVLASGCRRILIATTGWDAERAAIDAMVREARAAVVVAPNLSLGAAVFLRIVQHASALLASVDG